MSKVISLKKQVKAAFLPPSVPAPPPTDRGAQNTAPVPEKNQVCLDWLEFTLPYSFHLPALDTYLGTKDCPWQKCPTGMMGYRTQYLVNGSRVLTQGTAEMGHHVILSGGGLRAFRGNFDKLLEFVEYQGRFTRVDIAIDDVEGWLNLRQVISSLEAGNVRSIFKGYRILQGGSISDGMKAGTTIYLGSPSSNIMIRIYDKAAEIEEKTGVRPCDHWIRVEIQLRDVHANKIGGHLSRGESATDIALGLLARYVAFCRPGVDDQGAIQVNKSRWGLVSWWKRFLQGASALRLQLPKKVNSLENKLKWFANNVAPTFAAICQAFGADKMTDLYKLGSRAMSPALRDMVMMYHASRPAWNVSP